MESFDAAHHGRCPGCGMNDEGTHFGHRYSEGIYWQCDEHGSAFEATKTKYATMANFKREAYEVPAEPDANCKTCRASLKAVARFHKAIQELI